MSYYTEGLKVVDITDPSEPVEIGGYDSYQGGDGQYNGAWSAYPFFPSGKIIIGDMSTGLYVVDVDLNGPHKPTGFIAYSDYRTPTKIQLSWTDPTTLVSGDPISPLRVKC